MTQHPFDPFALWRDTLSKWETGFNDLANKNMASPEFSQLMNQAMGMSVRMQHAMGEIMGRYLTAMNMPSRADLVAIGERLQGIEDQLGRLTGMVERISAAPSAGATQPYAGPPRTKRPSTPFNGPSPAAAAHAAVAAAPAAAAKPARRAKAAKRKAKAS
jgi:hypothetical protein